MMGRKRRASSDLSTAIESSRRERLRKTRVVSYSDEESEDNEIGDEEFPINCILDETDSQYLIDWEGDWTPTWVRSPGPLCNTLRLLAP